ncbi:MAG: nucleotidyltransferase family protein, partial [Thaumarchaeota archaeon]|nr:nucleotidyltransferase family protein [Nitrososphaerota archaeon]
MYGDSIFDFNLKKMLTQHKQKKSFITISLFEYKTNLPYGVIYTSKNGKVTAWKEKPEISADINMGCYVMEPGVFDFIPKNKPYGMDDLVRKIIAKKKPVQSFITKKGFMDIGDKTSYKKAYQQYLEKLGKI